MLVTLHTLLNAIMCCFQLNTEWGADANRKVDYLGIDAVGLTVYGLSLKLSPGTKTGNKRKF